ncbi:uncharacterized protein LOC111267320 [Varroa jacobsoni]|uniref:uncharacterized protein LOC111267320 n=1 Tax=Varroa jacobsoni TaxID=62625 RepID=UPI000BF709C2|nr:uncharacterized protein LOC111267320 [Varroa jacobsoni]
MFRSQWVIAFSIVVVAVRCGHIGANGGSSLTYHKQKNVGHYEFRYDIKDDHDNINGRQEKGSHGQVYGSYYLGEVGGPYRTVEYIADKFGFRAVIKTNEHGTKTSEPTFAPITSDFGKIIPSGSARIAGHHKIHYGRHKQTLGDHKASIQEIPAHGQDVKASYESQQPAYKQYDQHKIRIHTGSTPVAYHIPSLNYNDLFNYGAGLNGGYRKVLFVKN